jgi:hypothetical protein
MVVTAEGPFSLSDLVQAWGVENILHTEQSAKLMRGQATIRAAARARAVLAVEGVRCGHRQHLDDVDTAVVRDV